MSATAPRPRVGAAGDVDTAGAQLVRLLLRPHRRPCVVCAGTFDGVHAGHRELVRSARAIARADGMGLTALTFSPRPDGLLGPGEALPDLCSVPARIARLRAAGADDVVVIPFTRPVARLGADTFTALLVAELGLRTLVVGEDFALGRRREGDVTRLRALGLHVITVPAVCGPDGLKLSSSALRRAQALPLAS